MRTFYHHFPIQITKIKKKINFRHPNTRKDLGFCILVKSSQYKGEVRNSKFEKLIELHRVNVTGVYARSCYIEYTALPPAKTGDRSAVRSGLVRVVGLVPGAPTGPGGLPNAAYVARTAHYHIIIN